MTLTNRAAALVLVLYCLVLYLPGIAAVPPFDTDEALYAQSARQMLETGDFIQIRYQNEARSKKPVLSYWLEAAAAGLTGRIHEIWPYRLPSVLGVTTASLLTFWCGIGLFGRTAALLGAALFAATLMAVIQAHLARADALLVAIVVAAQGALALLHAAHAKGQPPPRGLWLAFWVAQGLAILIKGPILALTTLLTVVTLGLWERDWRWLAPLRPLPGLAITMAIAAPWFVAANLAGDDGFLGAAVTQDLLPKLLGVQEGHGGPPGYYLATGLGMLWPVTLLLGLAVPFAWRHRREPALRFCLAWIVPTWIAYELIPTKLFHYTLPTYPAVALVAAAAVLDHIQAPTAGGWARRLAPLAFAAAALAGAAFMVGLPLYVDGRIGAGAIVAAAAALAAGAAAWPAWQDRWRHALTLAMAGAAIATVVQMQFAFPAIEDLWLSRKLASKLAALGVTVPDGDPPVAIGGYTAGSAVFTLGTRTLLVSGREVADHIIDRPGAIAAVTASATAAFKARAAERGATVRELGTVSGFDYTRGIRRTLTLYAAAPVQ